MKLRVASYLLIVACSVMRMHGQERALNKSRAQSPLAYAIYDEAGKPTSWAELIEEVKIADVVLFGEFHDDPIVHWLQHELILDLLDTEIRPVLGAEMLETDDQLVIDEFLKGIINGCKKSSCNLIGGETAEMPGTYQKNKFDLAGFSVGVVDDKSFLVPSNRIIKLYKQCFFIRICY